MELLDQLRHLSVSHRRSLRDDDFFADRLHHRYTVAMLVLFCVVVTVHQYAGEPINCWVLFYLNNYFLYLNFEFFFLRCQHNLQVVLKHILIGFVGYKIPIMYIKTLKYLIMNKIEDNLC